jgi:hypothetical protein
VARYDVWNAMNDRKLDEYDESGGSPSAQTLALSARLILTCVRWYVAYPPSLRHLEEMMAERGVAVDHSTVHRWAIKLLPAGESVSATQAAGW